MLRRLLISTIIFIFTATLSTAQVLSDNYKRLSEVMTEHGEFSREYASALFLFVDDNLQDMGMQAAKDSLARSMKICEHLGVVDDDYLNSLLYLRDLLEAENLKDEVLELDKKALEKVQILKDDTHDYRLEILWNLSRDYFAVKDSDNGFEYRVKALEEVLSINDLRMQEPRKDRRFLEIVKSLFEYADYFEESFAIRFKKQVLDVHFDGDNSSEEYFYTLYDLMKYCLYNGNPRSVLQYADELTALAIKHTGTGSKEYADCLYYAIASGDRCKDKSFTDRYVKIAREALNSFGKNSYNSFVLEYTIASAYYSFEDYWTASEEFGILSSIVDNAAFNISEVMLSNYYSLGAFILQNTDLDKAEAFVRKSIELKESNDVVPIKEHLQLAGILRNSNRFADAIELYYQVMDETGRDNRSAKLDFDSAIRGIAHSKLGMGEHAEASGWMDLALYDAEKTFGKNSDIYASCLVDKSMYCSEVGQNEESLRLLLEAMEIFSACGMTESWARTANDAGITLARLGRYPEARGYIGKSLSFFESKLPADEKGKLAPLVNMYMVSNSTDDSQEAKAYADSALAIISRCNLERSTQAYSFHGMLGFDLMNVNDAKALEHFERCLDIASGTHLERRLDHLLYSSYYYKTLLRTGKRRESAIKTLLDEYFKEYRENYASFSYDERERFLSGVEFKTLKDDVFCMRESARFDDMLFDFLLMSKGLLVSSSLNFNSAIAHSGNPRWNADLQKLQAIKRQVNIAKYYGRQTDMHLSDSLNAVGNFIERMLIGSVKDSLSYSYVEPTHFSEVSAALGKDEIAVEFVVYDGRCAAMVVRRNSTSPLFYELCSVSELEDIITKKPSLLYGSGEVSSQLYQMIWGPLERSLRKAKTIYFSPDGILHNLALESMVRRDGRRMDEVYHMLRCSSTGIIARRDHVGEFSTAALYGGVQYDVEEGTMISRSLSSQSISTSSHSFTLSDSSLTRKGWNYLPGTLVEVENISRMMEDRSFAHSIYVASDANEESFKSMSGCSPSLIHLATHGFFIPSSKTGKAELFIGKNLSDAINAADDNHSPMLRSGLLLSGGNSVWRGSILPGWVEDGVLTSLEIADLDLSGTEMVVLSACETGIGDLGNDGVFGLQRAFKLSGVKTIVMSLWEVDDKVTSLFMTKMYQALLNGKERHESFEEAKQSVKSAYHDPYYWAPFIMLD